MDGGKNAIIVTELPYGVKKGGDGGVIEKIAELRAEKKVLTEVPNERGRAPGPLGQVGHADRASS